MQNPSVQALKVHPRWVFINKMSVMENWNASALALDVHPKWVFMDKVDAMVSWPLAQDAKPGPRTCRCAAAVFMRGTFPLH